MSDGKNFTELRLIKKGKSGILKVIFGRTGITALFVLAQFGFYLNMFSLLRSYFPILLSANFLLQIFFVIILVNDKENSDVQLTWLILTAIIPLYSVPMYYFIKYDVGNRKLKKNTIAYIEKSHNKIKQDEAIKLEVKSLHPKLYNLFTYINKTGSYPIFRNNDAKYYALGDEMFPDMLEAIRSAKKYIFLEYFIIDEGLMWGTILKLLSDKVKEGVEVRVLYDGMCEFSLLPHSYPKELECLGIRTRIFSKILPFISTSYNFRDHRKFLIVDGTTVFTGGINLADEYINHITRFGHWKDAGIRIRGEACKSCVLMFLQNWYLSKESGERRFFVLGRSRKAVNSQNFEAECDAYLAEKEKEVSAGSGYVIPYGDNPLDNEKVGEMVYLDIIQRAENYVYIMTPYLILDETFQTSLTYAAKKGVDVRIITPHIPDKKMVFANTRRFYRELVEAGVSIFEYEPGFIHSKVFLSDDKRAVVGSINLDYRSLYHNFENAVYLESGEFSNKVKEDFEKTFLRSIKINQEFLKLDSIFNKTMGAILKPFSYLM